MTDIRPTPSPEELVRLRAERAAQKARDAAEKAAMEEAFRAAQTAHLRLGFPPETIVRVRRNWQDFNIGDVRLDSLTGLGWDWISGGINLASPHFMIYGYVWCDDFVAGGVAHSCAHGPGPHHIKIVIVKKDNDPKLMRALRRHCGLQPGTKAYKAYKAAKAAITSPPATP